MNEADWALGVCLDLPLLILGLLVIFGVIELVRAGIGRRQKKRSDGSS